MTAPRLFSAIALLAALPFSAAVDAAQCGDSASIAAYLARKYREKPRAAGMVGSRGYMQLYVAETGTWTVLLTSPEGISCIIAAGDGLEFLQGSKPPQGEEGT